MVCTFLGYISHKSVWSEFFIATRSWLMAIKSNPKIQTTHTYPDFKGHFYSLGTVLYVRFKTYSTGWRNSPTRFSTFSFFHNSNLSGPLSKGLKYFRFWLSFRWVIRFLGSKKLPPRGIIPRGVKIYFCPRTFFKNEKCSSLIAEKESIFIFVTLSL